MMLRVRFFAVLRDQAGSATVELPVPDGSRVGDALAALAAAVPGVSPWLPRCRFAVNAELVHADAPLRPGDELALLPPVSGG